MATYPIGSPQQQQNFWDWGRQRNAQTGFDPNAFIQQNNQRASGFAGPAPYQDPNYDQNIVQGVLADPNRGGMVRQAIQRNAYAAQNPAAAAGFNAARGAAAWGGYNQRMAGNNGYQYIPPTTSPSQVPSGYTNPAAIAGVQKGMLSQSGNAQYNTGLLKNPGYNYNMYAPPRQFAG